MCLPILGAIVGLAGAVVQGIGAANQQRAQAQSYADQAERDRQQALVHERQSRLERIKSSYEAKRYEDRGARITGSQVANYGASGVETSGSIADVINQTAEEAALDVAAVRYGGVISSENEQIMKRVSENDSRINRSNQSSAEKAIPFAFAAPVIGGVGTFLRTAFA